MTLLRGFILYYLFCFIIRTYGGNVSTDSIALLIPYRVRFGPSSVLLNETFTCFKRFRIFGTSSRKLHSRKPPRDNCKINQIVEECSQIDKIACLHIWIRSSRCVSAIAFTATNRERWGRWISHYAPIVKLKISRGSFNTTMEIYCPDLTCGCVGCGKGTKLFLVVSTDFGDVSGI